MRWLCFFFFFQAEDGIRDIGVTGVQTCALPICRPRDCHHTHSWHTDGAVSSVSFVRGASRGAMASELAELVDDDVDRRRLHLGHLREILDHAPLHRLADVRQRRAPLHGEVELERPVLELDTAVAADEPGHARDLARRVGGVSADHVGGDVAVTLHHAHRRTSSVASGRAKNRNGTNVVPSPGETCITVAPRSYTPSM